MKLVSSERRRRGVVHVRQKLGFLERRACCYLCQPRSTLRRKLVAVMTKTP